jgi:cation diffusion facilitator family transporter
MPSRQHAITRITLVGSVCNLLLMLAKIVAGIIGHSAALIADGIHSLSDLVTDFMVLVFVRIADKPHDRGHEYGHGRYETLATAIIGLLLLVVGAGIGWNGLCAIYHFGCGEKLAAPAPIALWAALLSIVVKELLYRYTARCGRRHHSPATIANAWHHRSDALSSVGTALGVGGALLLGEQWSVLDPLAAVVVSVFILRVSIQLMLPSVSELVDSSLPEADEQFIIDTILAHPGVSDPHHLRTRTISHTRAIEVHFRMDGRTPLEEAHEAASAIERTLRAHFGPATLINTHVEPLKAAGQSEAPCRSVQ